MTFPGEVFFSYVFELCFYLKERQKERDGGREEKEEAERVSDSGSLFDCLQWLGSSWDEPRSGVRNSVCLLYGWQAPGHSEPLMLLSPSTCISRKADWGTGVRNWILVFHYEPWCFNWCFISRLTIHSCCRIWHYYSLLTNGMVAVFWDPINQKWKNKEWSISMLFLSCMVLANYPPLTLSSH